MTKSKGRYYWPGYYESVRQFVLSCFTCQRFGRRNPPAELHPSPVTKEPMWTLMIDYMTMPLSKNGNQYILLVIVCYTNWIDAIALPTATSEGTVTFIYAWIDKSV